MGKHFIDPKRSDILSIFQVFPKLLPALFLNPFSTEPVLQITLFFTCSNVGALLCNYLLDEGSNGREFSTMKRQDGHLQFDPKGNNLSSYAHGQLRVEQAKLAIA
jgi:hypothetical protein